MAAPTLADYEYQFMDTGVKLNSSVALPFIDLDKVTGLDMPKIDAQENSLDGQHGGVIYARFFEPRTIVLDGTLYADPNNVEVYIDTLNANFMPTNQDYPLYFKGPGVAQRYIMCRPVGFNYDIDRLRSIGSSSIQIQLKAGDVRKYIDNANQTMTAETNYTPVNAGNMNTYPIFTITGAWTSITFTNNTQGLSVTLTDTRVAGDITVVNMKDRFVTVNGARKSTIVTTAGWWDIPPSGGQTVKFTVTGSPTSVVMATKQGWI